MSIFHDDLIKAYQNANIMYQQISKRYFQQNIRQDIKDFVKTYYKCQQRKSTKQNNQKRMISSTDIFKRQGIDIVKPLPITKEGNRYIVVAIDYFTRWSETRAIKVANAETIATFIYKEIIC